MTGLVDSHGRRLEYLRLSVTDRCNYRCSYCLPHGCPAEVGPPPLAVAEIERLARAFAALGFWKVRLTGGEPTLRRDLTEIVERLARVPGFTRIGLTTNGSRLAGLVGALRRAGLASLNVSIDSLDPARFERITGPGRLDDVLAGLEAAVAAGIPSVKVNAVLLRGLEDGELDAFAALTRRLPVTVRFIELMRTEENAAFFEESYLPAREVAERLAGRGWQALPPGDGVAVLHRHPEHQGQIGLISAYGDGFCGRCNRLRVASNGDLRPCLFGAGAIPLRPYLASDAGLPFLLQAIGAAARAKPAGHQLRQGRSGGTTTLATIGG